MLSGYVIKTAVIDNCKTVVYRFHLQTHAGCSLWMDAENEWMNSALTPPKLGKEPKNVGYLQHQ